MRILTAIKAIGAGIVLACLLVGSFLVYRPLLEEKRRLESLRDAYQGDNDRMAEEIDRLKQKQALFSSDPDFVEQVARKANRVRPHEVVFVFPAAAQP